MTAKPATGQSLGGRLSDLAAKQAEHGLATTDRMAGASQRSLSKPLAPAAPGAAEGQEAREHKKKDEERAKSLQFQPPRQLWAEATAGQLQAALAEMQARPDLFGDLRVQPPAGLTLDYRSATALAADAKRRAGEDLKAEDARARNPAVPAELSPAPAATAGRAGQGAVTSAVAADGRGQLWIGRQIRPARAEVSGRVHGACDWAREG